jgi:hypothetical protein
MMATDVPPVIVNRYRERSMHDRGAWPKHFVIALLLSYVGVSPAESKKADRPVVGQASSPAGGLLRRDKGEWKALAVHADVRAGDLLVALPGAAVDSKNGAVRLSLLGDLAQLSPYPILESAVVLEPATTADLAFMLDRGRVDVVNRKSEGAAKVQVRFRDVTWELTLAEPGARAALETYGRFARGTHFRQQLKAGETADEPTADVILLVLQGQVDLKTIKKQYALKAPPGPAYFHWDSVAGADGGPTVLDKLPAWADPEHVDTPRAQALRPVLSLLRRHLAEHPVAESLAAALHSVDPSYRRLGVYSLGACDDLAGLTGALVAEKADVRDSAVRALNHWIGRGPGRDRQLYNYLIKEGEYSPTHAAIVLDLLHSFSEADLARKETFETLIQALDHPRPAIRELARFHLDRSVPDAKSLGFDALASEADRAAAIKKWQQLLDDGRLPPRAKTPSK